MTALLAWGQIADGAGYICVFVGSLLCLAAGVGLNRFPDLLSRMHAAAKPQVLGVLLVLLGVGLATRSGLDVGMLVLVGIFQLLTAPVSSHMLSRAAMRTGQVDLAHGGCDVDTEADSAGDRPESS